MFFNLFFIASSAWGQSISWTERAGKYADQFYEAMARAPGTGFHCPPTDKTKENCEPNKSNPEKLKEQMAPVVQSTILTALAKQKEEQVSCATKQVDQLVTTNRADYEELKADTEKKINKIAELSHAYLGLSDKMLALSRSRQPEHKAELLQLRKEIKDIPSKIASIENTISYGQTEPIKKLLLAHLAKIKSTSLPLPALDSQKFSADYLAAMKDLQKSLHEDQKHLMQAVQSGGKTLDRSAKEALFQDEKLLEGFKKQHPEILKSSSQEFCELKHTYNDGAQARDRFLLYGSVATTFASMGTGALAQGAARGSLAMTAANSTRLLHAAKSLGLTGAVFDVTTGIKGLTEACGHVDYNNTDDCNAFSIQALRKNNCKLAAVVDGLGVTTGTLAVAGTVASLKASSMATNALTATTKSKEELELLKSASRESAESRKVVSATDRAVEKARAVLESADPANERLPHLRVGLTGNKEEDLKWFHKRYTQMEWANVDENVTYSKVALEMKSAANSPYTVIDIENSVQQKLNTKLGSKATVDAANNRFFELMNAQMQKLQKEFPGVEVLVVGGKEARAAGFKDLSVILKGRATPAFRARLNELYKQAKNQFAQDMIDLKVVNKEDHPEKWFKAAGGSTVDSSNLTSRVSRGLSEDRVHWYDEPVIQQQIKDYIAEAKIISKDIYKSNLRGVDEPLMSSQHTTSFQRRMEHVERVETDEGTFYTPNKTIVAMMRKESDPEVLTQQINSRLQTDFTVTEVRAMQSFADLADTASPKILTEGARKFATLEDAPKGGFNIDTSGMGASNADSVHRAILKSKNAEELLGRSRQGERQVTSSFRKTESQREKITRGLLEKKYGRQIDWVCSGDDCVGKVSRALSANQKQELVRRLSNANEPSSMRISFVNDKVMNAMERSVIGQHGEEIEKVIRKKLYGVVDEKTMKNVTLGIDMRGSKIGEGPVGLHIGNKRQQIKKEELEMIREAFKEAVKEFNQKYKIDKDAKAKYFVDR